MKIQLTFKTPDCMQEVDERFDMMIEDLENDPEEKERLETERIDVKKKLERWIEYGEYVQIEFDTDLMSAEVLVN